MLKIVYAHDGNSIYDLIFLSHLTKKHEVYFLTFNPKPTFTPKNMKIVVIPQPTLNTKTLTEGFWKYALTPIRLELFKAYLKKLNPDVLIGCWIETYGFYSAYSGFKPFILFVWGSDVMVMPKKYPFLNPIVRYTIRKADLILVDSMVQEKEVVRFGGSPKKVLRFPWVNLEEFYSGGFRENIRKSLGWEENHIIISLRNHKPIYNVENLIEAIPLIIKKRP